MMHTTEEFERAVEALGVGAVLDEIKLLKGNKVREAIGFVGKRRIVWTADGHALTGRERAPELDLKFE